MQFQVRFNRVPGCEILGLTDFWVKGFQGLKNVTVDGD